jgi:energy-coupling factor transporter transmembrane protein EcfT
MKKLETPKNKSEANTMLKQALLIALMVVPKFIVVIATIATIATITTNGSPRVHLLERVYWHQCAGVQL